MQALARHIRGVFATSSAGSLGAAALRIGLGLVFAVAGAAKLGSLSAFAGIIGDYGLLPKFLHFPSALLLSLAEVAAGAGLALNRKYCLETVTALTVLFIAVLGYGAHLGLDADCGCFGPSDPETLYHHGLKSAIARDLAMLAVCALLFWRRLRSGDRTAVPDNPQTAPEA